MIDAPKKKLAGVLKSLLLKSKAKKKSLDKIIKEMGKKASLRYKASRDGHSSDVLW
jgi:hypothetical protein